MTIALSSSAEAKKSPDVADQIPPCRLEEIDGFIHIAKGRREIVKSLAHGILGYFLIEFAQLCSACLVGFGHPLQDGLQLLLQAFDLDLDILTHALGQSTEHLRLDDLAFVHGRHGEASRGAQEGYVLPLRLGTERLERLLLPRPELLIDGAAPHLVILTFKQGG